MWYIVASPSCTFLALRNVFKFVTPNLMGKSGSLLLFTIAYFIYTSFLLLPIAVKVKGSDTTM
jgi:hypothetical protein